MGISLETMIGTVDIKNLSMIFIDVPVNARISVLTRPNGVPDKGRVLAKLPADRLKSLSEESQYLLVKALVPEELRKAERYVPKSDDPIEIIGNFAEFLFLGQKPGGRFVYELEDTVIAALSGKGPECISFGEDWQKMGITVEDVFSKVRNKIVRFNSLSTLVPLETSVIYEDLSLTPIVNKNIPPHLKPYFKDSIEITYDALSLAKTVAEIVHLYLERNRKGQKLAESVKKVPSKFHPRLYRSAIGKILNDEMVAGIVEPSFVGGNFSQQLISASERLAEDIARESSRIGHVDYQTKGRISFSELVATAKNLIALVPHQIFEYIDSRIYTTFAFQVEREANEAKRLGSLTMNGQIFYGSIALQNQVYAKRLEKLRGSISADIECRLDNLNLVSATTTDPQILCDYSLILPKNS